MAIGWITTRTEPQVMDAFRATPWEIKILAPVQFIESNSFPPCNVEVIVFEISDRALLDLCRNICIQKIAPMLAIVMNLAYAQAALDAGADDFVMLPVDPIEALLRVHKLARTSTFVRIGELEIDLAGCRVRYDNFRVRLSSIEFRLLACLAKRAGQTVSYAEILEDVWGWDRDPGTLAQVKNCVNRVRKKIEPDVHNPEYIITVSRQGYRLRNQRQWEENRRVAERSDLLLES